MANAGYSAISADPSSSKTIPSGNHGSITISDNGSYSYQYGPSGLAGLVHNRYTLMCAGFASIGGLSFGYDQGVIANVLVMPQFVADFGMSPTQKGFVTAILELGALIGALSAGTFADKYSRRQALFVACIFAFVGSLLQALSATHTLIYLLLGRIIAGVGIGALSTLAPLYISEISPPETRGSLVSLEQLSIVIGVVAGFWIGFLTRNFEQSSSWRTPLFLQLVPALVLGVGCFILPASPRLLVLQGHREEARIALDMLRRESDGDNSLLVEIELLEMQTEAILIDRALSDGLTAESKPKSSFDTEVLAWKRLLNAKNRPRAWIGVLTMFFQQWSGINALLYFGPTLVQSIGIGDPQDPHPTSTLIVAGGIGIVQLLAVLPAILVVDVWGRRPLLRAGSVGMASSHVGVAVLILFFEGHWKENAWAAWVAVGAMYIFTASYGLSFGPIGWLLPAEVFPLSVRSKGVALSTASNWVNNFIIGFLTPLMVELSPPTTFLVFALACVGAWWWVTTCVPETANVGLEEMDEVFTKFGYEGGEGERERELREVVEREVGLRAIVDELHGG
ncbi:MFS monosaccharide transporter [Flagelloscypha sp. PMI_526]|nr:MFS monosaccharide transporter [Flagelloscypha sp. PMI_526]